MPRLVLAMRGFLLRWRNFISSTRPQSRAGQCPVQRVGQRLVGLAQDVAVDAERCLEAAMPKALLHALHVGAGLYQEAGTQVAQVMNTDGPYPFPSSNRL